VIVGDGSSQRQAVRELALGPLIDVDINGEVPRAQP